MSGIPDNSSTPRAPHGRGCRTPRWRGRALGLTVAWAMAGCTGYAASHGPRPLGPDQRTFSVGASVLRELDDQGVLVLPELGYRKGLTDRIDGGIEWAGYSIGVDALASIWERDAWILSAGMGASLTALRHPHLHPELYFGTDHLFGAVRVIMSPGGWLENDGFSGWYVPGFTLGAMIGEQACTNLLPTVTAWREDTTLLVFTLNARISHSDDPADRSRCP